VTTVQSNGLNYKIVSSILQVFRIGRPILKIFTLLKGGAQRRGGESEPPIGREDKTYEQLMDELTIWNIEHTDIVGILRKEVEEERLSKWSNALEKGVRKNLDPKSGPKETNPYFSAYLDLYQFVRSLRTKLVGNPAMRDMKFLERADSLLVCILCGIRALQKEKGAKRPIDTLQWMMLERYLG